MNGARGRWLALGVLCTSLLAIVIDNTIVNVALPAAKVPGPVLAAARESFGSAVQLSTGVADPAREAFVHAMSRASALVALVTALGALIAWRNLPARAGAQVDRAPGADGDPAPAHETSGSRVAGAGG